MSINFKRTALAIILCFIFVGAGLIVWNAAYYLAELTRLHYRVFDVVAVFLVWCGFISSCIVNDKTYKDESKIQETK